MNCSSRFLLRWSLRLGCLLAGFLLGSALLGGVAFAQTPDPATEPNLERLPLLIFNAASVERLLTDVDWTFAVADRPELSDFIGGLLGKVGDLKGIDRDQPIGVMLFLKEGLPPSLVPLVYIPVTNIDDLMKTLSLGPRKANKQAGKEGRYELKGPGDPLYAIQRKNYAIITNSEDLFDSKLPEPSKLVGSLSTRFDIAATAQLQSIPKAVRELFVAYLRGSMEAELQRRDEEAEAAYLIRRSAGISNLEFITQLITQGDQVTIGWDASEKRRTGVLELNLDATPGSEFSKYCSDIAGKASAFQALLNDQQPFAMSASWAMNKREITAASGAIKALRTALRQEFKVPAEEKSHAIDRLTDALKATAEAGHMDFCVQFSTSPEHRFILVGGGGMVGADSFAGALREMLQLLEKEDKLQTLQLDVMSHQNISFHKVIAKTVPKNEQKLYGGVPALYLGAGNRRLWFAVGLDEALPALKQAMDVVSTPPSLDRPAPATIPFQVVFRMSPWLKLPGPDGERGQADHEFARSVFTSREKLDAAKLDIRPTENGMRIRLELDEGYIRFVGMQISKQIDRFNAASSAK